MARHLVDGGETIILAAKNPPHDFATDLGARASATTVDAAIAAADTVVFAVWLDVMKSLIDENRDILTDKIVVDPSNPISVNEKGEFSRNLPDGISAGSVISDLLPDGTHYVKAFGTLAAGPLEKGANRSPKAVLFYATDDAQAEAGITRLITAAGFEPMKAGGIAAALRIEMYGDLHEFGGLNGKLVDADEARTGIQATASKG